MRSRKDGVRQSRTACFERQARSGSKLRRPLWLAVLAAAMLTLLAACTEEGQERVGDALENVSTTAPITLPEDLAPEDGEPEAEPVPEPEPDNAAPVEEVEEPAAETETSDELDEGLTSSDWVLLILLVAVGIALVGAAISAAGRYSASRSARKDAMATRIGDIVGSCRWIHDSGSMEVLLVQDPSQVQSAWASVRTRMMDVESQISTLAANTDDRELQQILHDLGQALTGLRSAEEAYVTAKSRAVGPDGDELLSSANQTVIDRRRELQVAIEPLAHMSHR